MMIGQGGNLSSDDALLRVGITVYAPALDHEHVDGHTNHDVISEQIFDIFRTTDAIGFM